MEGSGDLEDVEPGTLVELEGAVGAEAAAEVWV